MYDLAKIFEQGRRRGRSGPLEPGSDIVTCACSPWLAVAYVPISRVPWGIARRIWFSLGVATVFEAAALLAGRSRLLFFPAKTYASLALLGICATMSSRDPQPVPDGLTFA